MPADEKEGADRSPGAREKEDSRAPKNKDDRRKEEAGSAAWTLISEKGAGGEGEAPERPYDFN